jgi:hypothetical protein
VNSLLQINEDTAVSELAMKWTNLRQQRSTIQSAVRESVTGMMISVSMCDLKG